ncbi:MAG: aldo/keto reductase [Victivallaceae bacterium]|nr:aldo/keto reductase [Victivallaceae bacterium]
MLNKRTLGRTGLQVSELALGGLFISSHGTDRASATEVIKRAWELGINYIDTAPGYLDSEEVLGEALAKIDADFIISTKFGYKPEPFEPQNKAFLQNALTQSLNNLKRDKVDILMIHEPDRHDDPDFMDWWTDKENYDGPIMEVLAEAKAQGKCGFTGLGGTTAYEMANVMNAGNFDVILTAFQYNALWREAEHEILPAAARHNMGIVCGSPLHQGNLATQYVDDVINKPAKWLSSPRRKQFTRLYELVNDLKVGMPELCLRFILSNPDVSTVLSGVKSIAELESNVAAAEKGPLSAEIITEINEIAAMVPFKPYLEPLALPFTG